MTFCQDLLQGREGSCYFWRPGEGLLFQELSEGASNVAVVADELTVVASQTQKTAKRPWSLWSQPRLYNFHLCWIHGHATNIYNMTQVRHTLAAEDALALFDRDMMLLQCSGDNTNMLQVFRPRRTVNQNIVKEDKNKPA
jgi:hypothetical protein